MAVSQESGSNSKKPVEEPVQHCGEEGTVADPCGLIKKRKSDGPSTRPKGIRKDYCGVVRSHMLGGHRTKHNSDRLSDIDDIEVVGYLHTKKQMHLKRVLWEAMYGGYLKAKKQKQAGEKKKGVSMKKATKTTKKVEPERRSSRINYSALKALNGNLKSCDSAETKGPDSQAHGSQSSPHGNSRHSIYGSNEDWYEDEDERDNGSHEDDTHWQYSHEDYCDDFDF